MSFLVFLPFTGFVENAASSLDLVSLFIPVSIPTKITWMVSSAELISHRIVRLSLLYTRFVSFLIYCHAVSVPFTGFVTKLPILCAKCHIFVNLPTKITRIVIIFWRDVSWNSTFVNAQYQICVALSFLLPFNAILEHG